MLTNTDLLSPVQAISWTPSLTNPSCEVSPLAIEDFTDAMKYVRPSQLTEFEAYIPTVRWEDIGG